MSKGTNLEFARLQSKDPTSWAVSEVGMWLEFIECGEYKIAFIENSISGQELFDLEDDDLLTIGVKKLGLRKKILSEIKNLQKRGGGSAPSTSHHSASDNFRDDLSDSGSGISGSLGSPTEVCVKCFFEDEIRVIRVKPDTSLRDLKKKIKNEFGQRLSVKWKDNDGDLIPIRKDRHWKSALTAGLHHGNIRLMLSEKVRSVVSATETAVLETMVDGVIIIDIKGLIQFINKSAERIFQYDRSQVLGKNIKMLMTSADADRHDGYLSSYLRTGEARIIGSGRRVQGKKRDGTTFPAYLSISETKMTGRHTFTGTVQDMTGKDPIGTNVRAASSIDTAAQFSILDNILDSAIVIDERGTVQFCNRVAYKLLGFSAAEVVGRNVKMLMPTSQADVHDTYIRNYITTGHAKVIGVGRDVIAQCKDGTILPVNLSLTEHKLSDGKRFFTGILRKIEEEKPVEKSVLQQEREVLDNLVVAAVVIDEKGTIHGFNKAAQDLFGFTLIDVVGKNIKLLMTGSDKDNHDKYLSEFLRTGKSKVIGVGRDVVAQHKNGSIIPLRLSVTTRSDGQKRIFTGVLQKL
eukprot:TRINITY_DN77_c0_g1_i2.p1 TRINITY_DN77_c0_g1~~TRINITY_DN77_c0_g1_i2.p1  ORF type:complete len:576 (-),score=147.27 TRINITY_DN77_c0_g1_i2:78-1805(-)